MGRGESGREQVPGVDRRGDFGLNVLRIATRQSRLALWQAEEVARRLEARCPDLECRLVQMTTEGDRFLDAPLAAIGGKGLFVKELERSLLDGRADVAVHSMKDVTVDFPDGLHLPVIMPRACPWDAFVDPGGRGLAELPDGTRVGSSSLRRRSQLLARFPGLEVVPVRGNVDTRLAKLDRGEVDGLVLACAGLERLALESRITERLPEGVMLPAIGQGAMGIECRVGDERVQRVIAALADPETTAAVRAERAMNEVLAGGCHAPVAGFATLRDGTLSLRGLVGSVDGAWVVRHIRSGPMEEPESLGAEVAEALLRDGGREILASIAPEGQDDGLPSG